MSRPKLRENPKDWEARYQEGDLDEAQWLYKVLYGGFGSVASNLVSFRLFAQDAVERIPKITYPVYPGYWREKEGVLWTCIEDVYAFADEWTGGVFSFAEFFHDLAKAETPQAFNDCCEDAQKALTQQADQAREQAATIPAQGGRPKKETNRNTIGSHPDAKPGILRRLARKRPDLLARFENGELSAHAAALEAGLRFKPVQLARDPARAAERIFNARGPQYCADLAGHLAELAIGAGRRVSITSQESRA